MGAKFRNALGRDIHARESALQIRLFDLQTPFSPVWSGAGPEFVLS